MRPGRWGHDRRTSALVALGTVLTVAGVYAVIVLGGDAVFGHTGSPSIGLSVLATAIVALGLEPTRAALQSFVSERLDHGRRSPYDVLSGFTDSLVDTDDPASGPGDLTARIARHLAVGTGATWAQVWLTPDGTLELAATWPPDAPAETRRPDAAAPGVRSRNVVLDGRRLGILRVREPDDAPFGPMEERLLGDLAAQAGIVLHRAHLRSELARRATDLALRADELQESRRRLVDTHDAERRRLERDIHDGAQQHLVALVVNLRLAQTLAGKAPDRARTVLSEQVTAVDEAIAALVDLSQGLYPPALVEQGVGAAMREVLGRTSVPIAVVDDGLGRLPEDVEAALYFCALEAVQNAVKHSGGSSITVELSSDGRQVRLEVRDDGIGLPAGADSSGHGLGNMRDRIDAVSGRLVLSSEPGLGATVLATIPLPAQVPS